MLGFFILGRLEIRMIGLINFISVLGLCGLGGLDLGDSCYSN